ncbi:hypothetical protein NQZ68_038341 [Dissostichus eleginoides]|nr:hypothetical protein NQZ68_038341 [Dissostichus eleginoides]
MLSPRGRREREGERERERDRGGRVSDICSPSLKLHSPQLRSGFLSTCCPGTEPETRGQSLACSRRVFRWI